MSTSSNIVGNVFDSSVTTTADGSVIITGDLTVEGTTTTVESTSVLIEDKIMELAHGTSGTPSGDAGIIVERGSSTNSAFIWDESADEWVIATTSATGASSGDLSLTDANLRLADVTVSGGDITCGNGQNATLSVTTTGSGTDGRDLTVSAGSAPAGGANQNGGDLILKAGDGDGTGTSIMTFSTKVSGTDAVAERMRIHTDGNVGIGTAAPSHMLHMAGADAYLLLQNTTAENGDGEAETRVLFADHAGNPLAQIEGSHSGGSDDDKGKLIFSTNNGDDADPQTALTIDDTRKSTFTTTSTDGIVIDQDYSVTADSTLTGLTIDIDKTGASEGTNTMYGINIDMDNTTAIAGTNTMTGIKVTPTCTHPSGSGSVIVKGMEVVATGSSSPEQSTVRALDLTSTGGDYNQGIYMQIADGGPDIKMVSSADAGDYATIAVGAAGLTTITTVDDGGTAAHIKLEPDGSVIVGSAPGSTPKLVIGDAVAEDTMLAFDGNAQDFRLGIVDSSDTFEIGVGQTHGTTPTMILDPAQNIDIFGMLTIDSEIADEKCSGITAAFTAGEALNRGDVVYFKSDSKMHKVNMTAGNADAIPAVAMAAEDISLNNVGKFLMQGVIHDAGTFDTYTVAARLYAPEAEGPPTQTKPSTDGDLVQVIGWAITADKIYFNPSPDYIEVA
jgi:hypothetical protein